MPVAVTVAVAAALVTVFVTVLLDLERGMHVNNAERCQLLAKTYVDLLESAPPTPPPTAPPTMIAVRAAMRMVYNRTERPQGMNERRRSDASGLPSYSGDAECSFKSGENGEAVYVSTG